jgi:DNA-binding transcriptional MerR regulator
MVSRYRIGEFADLSGVTAKTLRFYDEIGLFRPANVDPLTRYRYYLPKQLDELASILALKDLGVTLANVRQMTGKAGSSNERRSLLKKLRESLQRSIRHATQSLQWIDAALYELDDARPLVPVTVKRRPSLSIASIRAKVESYSEIAHYEEELLKALPEECIGEVRGVLWHRCADSGGLEGEPFVGLKRRVQRRTFYEVKQLPSTTLACAYSGQDDESSEQAYVAIGRWMKGRGYCLAGPKREIYLPQMLEIQFPMKSA